MGTVLAWGRGGRAACRRREGGREGGRQRSREEEGHKQTNKLEISSDNNQATGSPPTTTTFPAVKVDKAPRVSFVQHRRGSVRRVRQREPHRVTEPLYSTNAPPQEALRERRQEEGVMVGGMRRIHTVVEK